MAVELFFNELSQEPAAANISDARMRMLIFMELVGAAITAGSHRVLLSQSIWDAADIEIGIVSINSNCELTTDSISIRHASRKSHILNHAVWHINLPGYWRLYYEPDSETHQIFIGYVGKHLRTVKFG